ncbi:UDP-N-acetylglucosamine 2-epimerase (hydrolyzing) [Pelagibacterales bacterium SAG-MED29]|nr:UDP-N-acetylglucosamine 2-epimerase (hydrolyzing) [Pelagibacterales bacterium SAG-MED29]
MKKKIFFITATRADFGKLKSLIKITSKSKKFEVKIIVTGMHNMREFGSTYMEVEKNFGKRIIRLENQKLGDNLNEILKNTIYYFSKIVQKHKPDLIVVHGDRIETLACALVGSMSHILTAHIEGGEVSGTIDDTIRHAVTKLCHVHFVGSISAGTRVRNMGEKNYGIFNIGSPDIDLIHSKNLPSISLVKKRYEIDFKEYAILLWHPVTSELKNLKNETTKLVNFVNQLEMNTIVIYPNNDPGSKIILDIYKKYLNRKKTFLQRNFRFEYFITLLKNAKFIIGNSSCGIYEAPQVNTPAINIGSRQHKRSKSKMIKNINIHDLEINTIKNFLKSYKISRKSYYGDGNSFKKFFKIINKKSFWQIDTQKYFNDRVN